MSQTSYESEKKAAEDKYNRIQRVAESGSGRIIALKRQYDQLKAERNKTVRELAQKVKELENALKQNESNKD